MTWRRALWPVARGVLLGGAMLLAMAAFGDWAGYLLFVVAAAILIWMFIALGPVMRGRPCMFCGTRRTLPMLGKQVPPHWWQRFRKEDVSWVCVDHVENYVRLRTVTREPQ